MRLIGLVVVLAMAPLTVHASWVPDLSTWDYYWNFDNGTQGWTLGGIQAARWVDPNTEPNGPVLPDGQPSGGGPRNLYLPDQGYAELDVSSLNLGNGTGKVGFQIWARVYVPNLRPLGGFTHGYPGNMIHRAGLAVLRDLDNKPMYVAGNIDNGNIFAKDKTWDNTDRYDKKWTIEENVSPDTLWWDKWVTLVFDYNYTTPGKWNAAAYIPWASYVAPAGWHTLAENIDCNSNVHFSKLRIGAVNDGSSWTQAQFDDVYLKLVPEPYSYSAILFYTGLLGVARLRIRRNR
ncbi:MAG: hypothetical protein ACUVT8_09990 [Armatimonadota bacterium]